MNFSSIIENNKMFFKRNSKMKMSTTIFHNYTFRNLFKIKINLKEKKHVRNVIFLPTFLPLYFSVCN